VGRVVKTFPEPFKIRSVEPIALRPAAERRRLLAAAGYNLFRVHAADVFIDLLTDSGTGAMSNRQWASLHEADEAYAGSQSYARFEAAVRRVTGFSQVIPTHQGRAAERILFETILRPGDCVASNGLFDTTRANVERMGARGIDLPEPAALDPADGAPLKGGMNIPAFRALLAHERVKAVVLTCTSNAYGGHPVPLGNVHEVSALCRAHGVPLFIDAARFAENAGLLLLRDPTVRGRTLRDVALEIFAAADGCLMSAKKNGLAHMGGFLALRDPALAEALRNNLVVTEGFESYGGLAGRDLDAIAIGLEEVLDENLLMWRLAQVDRFAQALRSHSVPLLWPAAGHAVYIDAGALFPHLPAGAFPGHALACALYLEGGIRACEIGSLMFPGNDTRPQLTRLAVPWRTYTDAHLAYVAQTAATIAARQSEVKGYRIVSAPTALRHFRAVLEPVAVAERSERVAAAAQTAAAAR